MFTVKDLAYLGDVIHSDNADSPDDGDVVLLVNLENAGVHGLLIRECLAPNYRIIKREVADAPGEEWDYVKFTTNYPWRTWLEI